MAGEEQNSETELGDLMGGGRDKLRAGRRSTSLSKSKKPQAMARRKALGNFRSSRGTPDCEQGRIRKDRPGNEDRHSGSFEFLLSVLPAWNCLQKFCKTHEKGERKKKKVETKEMTGRI